LPAAASSSKLRLIKIMPARRKRRRPLPAFTLLFLALLFFLALQTGLWSRDSKLTMVINQEEGDVLLAVFNPAVEEITTIVIPQNTQLRAARQLGTWKAGSLWQLGKNEKLEGKLLQETVTYYLKLPVIAWADSPAEGFANGGLIGLLKAAALPYETNLKIGDRIKLALFSFSVKNFKKEEINLAETNLLRKTRLIDGEEGFILVGDLPVSIQSLFSDLEISQKKMSLLISDATGKKGVAEQVGEVVEVLGAKVAAIKNEEKGEFDCLVSGGDRRAVGKLARVFSCEKTKEPPSGNFDLEIRIGEGFARRF